MWVGIRIVGVVTAVLVAALALVSVALIALSEMGEVVVVETALPDGDSRRTRIWIVDTPEGPLVRGTGGKPWVDGARLQPEVILERGGRRSAQRFVELSDPADHERARQLMRGKYGLADELIDWVRELDDTAVFRVEPTAESP